MFSGGIPHTESVKKGFLILAVATLLLCREGKAEERRYLLGEMWVRVRVENPFRVRAIRALKKKYPSLKVVRIPPPPGKKVPYPIPARYQPKEIPKPESQMYRFKLPQEADIRKEVELLRRDRDVVTVEPNYIVKILDSLDSKE